MRSNLSFLVFLLTVFLSVSCYQESTENPQEQTDPATLPSETAPLKEQFRWILGNWKGHLGKTDFLESWKEGTDGFVYGEGITIEGNDTIAKESIRLELKNGDIFYVPLVDHNPGEVFFKLVSIKGKKAIFENKEHDFPQRIIYHSPHPDSLNARIEGSMGAEEKGMEFRMARVRL